MITPEERERSYERYQLYRANRARYETPAQATVSIAIFVGVFMLFKFGLNFNVVVGSIIAVMVAGAVISAWKYRQSHSAGTKNKTIVSDIENLINEENAEIIKVDGTKVSVPIPNHSTDKLVVSLNNKTISKDLERKISKKGEIENMDIKSTTKGYVNKNNQRNNGKTNETGTDYGQWFYEMECLNCGHKYKANGSDIWLRKCPRCQGGKP